MEITVDVPDAKARRLREALGIEDPEAMERLVGDLVHRQLDLLAERAEDPYLQPRPSRKSGTRNTSLEHDAVLYGERR